MDEHRWTMACPLDADACQEEIGPVLEALEEEGWTVFQQVDTGGFFGWTLRQGDDAVGVAVPVPGERDHLLVRAVREDLGEAVVERLRRVPALQGALPDHDTHALAEDGPLGA